MTVTHFSCGKKIRVNELLKKGTNKFKTVINLFRVHEGWEVAGSGLRHVKDGWKVMYAMRDGSTGSFSYSLENRDLAEKKFEGFLKMI